MHARLVGQVRAGNLVVADDVAAVERDVVTVGQVGDQRRRRLVDGGRVIAVALERIALDLDPDRVLVEVVVAGLVADVPERDHLRDEAVGGADDVMRGDVAGGGLEDAERVVVARLSVVDHDPVDVEPVALALGEVVIAPVVRARVLGVGGRNEVAVEALRALRRRQRRPPGKQLLGAGRGGDRRPERVATALVTGVGGRHGGSDEQGQAEEQEESNGARASAQCSPAVHRQSPPPLAPGPLLE